MLVRVFWVATALPSAVIRCVARWAPEHGLGYSGRHMTCRHPRPSRVTGCQLLVECYENVLKLLNLRTREREMYRKHDEKNPHSMASRGHGS